MRALIIGANGQDGIILRHLLKSLGMEVFGLTRNHFLEYPKNSQPLALSDFKLSAVSLSLLLKELLPDYIFHLGAIHGSSASMENVINSQKNEMYELHVNYVKSILNWQKNNPKTKSFIALSSQMFETSKLYETICENCKPNPINYYGFTKAEAFRWINLYREKYNVNVSGGILFNHTSIYSKDIFIFYQLSEQFVNIVRGKSKSITLRNAAAHIDISDANEIVSAIQKIIELNFLENFVLSKGKSYRLDHIIKRAAFQIGISQPNIISIDSDNEIFCPVGNIEKAQKFMNWNPKVEPWELLSNIVLNKLNGANLNG